MSVRVRARETTQRPPNCTMRRDGTVNWLKDRSEVFDALNGPTCTCFVGNAS